MDYTAKSYYDIMNELQELVKIEFPTAYRDFSNKNSYGFMLLNLIAQTTDMLNFYTDYNTKETYLTYAQERESLLDLANIYGYRVRKNTCSQVEITFKFTIKSTDYDSYSFEVVENGSYRKKLQVFKPEPNESEEYEMPVILSGMKLKTDDGLIQFINDTPIDFKYPNEVIEVDNEDRGTSLTIIKKEMFHSGEEVTINHTITELSNRYIIEISDEDFAYIKEVKNITKNEVWKEVDYLAQEQFIEDDNSNDDLLLTIKDIKEEFSNRKFITRMNENGNINIIFGSGSKISNTLSEALSSGNLSNLGESSSYGRRPELGDEFQITYVSSKGASANVASYSITKIESQSVTGDDGLLSDLEFYNENSAVFGSGEENDEELRQHIKDHINRSDSISTKGDYLTIVNKMPAKYGKINKVYVEKYKTDENNNDNTIAMYLDVENSNNSNILTNVSKWMDFHRMATDNILVTYPYTIALSVKFNLIAFGGYNKQSVVLKCIDAVKQFFDKLQINEPIIISQIYSELMRIEGVKAINGIEFKNEFDTYKTQGYPKIKYDINSATKDGVIYPPKAISIFKIINYKTDIKVLV